MQIPSVHLKILLVLAMKILGGPVHPYQRICVFEPAILLVSVVIVRLVTKQAADLALP
jgi:hypothetical protein